VSETVAEEGVNADTTESEEEKRRRRKKSRQLRRWAIYKSRFVDCELTTVKLWPVLLPQYQPNAVYVMFLTD
jgi:hypothetical protein